jgi:hypothetical protein
VSELFGRDFIVLVLMSVMGLVVFLVHFALIRRVWASTVSPRERFFLLVPPATPVIAWRAGHPLASITWTLAVTAYVILRFQG